jgi:hypothetical protein
LLSCPIPQHPRSLFQSFCLDYPLRPYLSCTSTRALLIALTILSERIQKPLYMSCQWSFEHTRLWTAIFLPLSVLDSTMTAGSDAVAGIPRAPFVVLPHSLPSLCWGGFSLRYSLKSVLLPNNHPSVGCRVCWSLFAVFDICFLEQSKVAAISVFACIDGTECHYTVNKTQP